MKIGKSRNKDRQTKTGLKSNVPESRQLFRGLQESKDKQTFTFQNLNALIEASPMAIVFLDYKCRITLWSPAAVSIFGWQEDEVMGSSNPVVSKDEEPGIQQLLKQGLAGENIHDHEMTCQRKDGRTISINLSVVPLRNIDQRIIGVSMIITDITERKRIEIALKTSEEGYRILSDGSRDAIMVADADANLVDVNLAAESLTGYTKAELKKMSIPDLHENVDLHAYHTYFDSIMAGEPAISEAKILKKDGFKVDTEFSSQRVFIKNKPYMHTVARDVSERKRLEKALRNERNRLKKALEEIKTLKGIVPICSKCKKIRDDKGYWEILESYIQKHTNASFSHGICPECSDELYGNEEWYIEIKKDEEKE